MADQLESFVVVVLFDVESLSCITHVSSINMRKDKDQKVTPIEMYLNHNTYDFSIKTRSGQNLVKEYTCNTKRFFNSPLVYLSRIYNENVRRLK